MARKRSSRGITAWLVTWEHSGDHAKPERRVAAVFSSRLGGDRVRELVEVLYANANSTVGELIGYARNTRSNPYQATFGSVNGVSSGIGVSGRLGSLGLGCVCGTGSGSGGKGVVVEVALAVSYGSMMATDAASCVPLATCDLCRLGGPHSSSRKACSARLLGSSSELAPGGPAAWKVSVAVKRTPSSTASIELAVPFVKYGCFL